MRQSSSQPTGLCIAAGNGTSINPSPITLEGIQDEGLRGNQVLQNILNTSEFLRVSEGGVSTVTVSSSGYPQIFYAGKALPSSSFKPLRLNFLGTNPLVSRICRCVVAGCAAAHWLGDRGGAWERA